MFAIYARVNGLFCKASSAKVEPCHPQLCANMPKIDNWSIDVENNSTADLDNLYKSKIWQSLKQMQTGERNFGVNFIFKRGLGAP